VRIAPFFTHACSHMLLLEIAATDQRESICWLAQCDDSLCLFRRFTEPYAAWLISKMLKAVGYCHRMGVSHRVSKEQRGIAMEIPIK